LRVHTITWQFSSTLRASSHCAIWILASYMAVFQNLQLHRHFPCPPRRTRANYTLEVWNLNAFSLITVLEKARVVLNISPAAWRHLQALTPDSFQAPSQPSRYRLYTLATAQFFQHSNLIIVICEENEGNECNMINLLSPVYVRSYDGGIVDCCCLRKETEPPAHQYYWSRLA